MDSLQELLSSVSPQDLEKLKGVAQGLLGGDTATKTPTAPPALPAAESLGLTPARLQALSGFLKAEQKGDSRTQFIEALKPFLSPARRARAEEAIRFLKWTDAMPKMREMLKHGEL